MMDDATPGAVVFVGHESVEHFVIDDVFDIPARHEFAVEQRMDADEPVLLLDASKDDVALRFLTTASPPCDRVVAQAIAKIAVIDAIEDRLQIEMLSFRAKLKLPLHCAPRHKRVTFPHGFACGFPLRWLFVSCAHGRKLLLQDRRSLHCHK